ncbi:MFS transporter [Acidipropionibacterium virtanenii]|uniref:Major facilitator superfamily (MFS) profile domain-containing protein n=1 Tax=Acidipropionibacterium virtanenii TaxID=2057246 RepID=A0A344UQQ5_9ACTN|nr:MFS transporter [Acidipropionibacterium virtanenii]AXE37603.1 hypothetical protein JS278_00406 [Acidipropionibacterium virtanenii]
MRSYGELLRIKEIWTTLVLAMLTRIPLFSLGTVLTLHVVTSLGMNYSSAGLVTTVFTIAGMISSPWRGSMVDRRGLRRTMIPSLLIVTPIWLAAPWIGYLPLLALVAIAGLWNYPVFTVPRQVLIARAPLDHRRAALSLDSVSVEICYMIGPTVAIIAATVWGTRPTIMACALIAVIGAAGLTILNPPTASETGVSPADTEAPPRMEASAHPALASRGVREVLNMLRLPRWLTLHTSAILIAVVATGFALGGMELTAVGQLRAMGEPQAIGWVLAASGLGSAVGGIVYGMLPRGASTPTLLLGLGITTAMAALASNPWQAAGLLCIAGIFCAPTLTSSVDSLSAAVPANSRGAVIGWQGSCMNAGTAMAAPMVGAAMDASGWRSGYLLAGLLGVIVAIAVLGAMRLHQVRLARAH